MKNYLILIVLVLFLTACEQNTQQNTAEAETPEVIKTEAKIESNDLSFKTSLNDLLLKTTPMKCTYKDLIENKEYEQTIYISGKKFRTDGKMEEMEFHAISDGEWVYSWNTLTPKGFKMKLVEPEQQENVETNIDLEKEYQFDCSPWVVTEDKFTLPSEIEFEDLTILMNEAMQNSEEALAQACSACDSAPDEAAKQECKESIGC